MNLQDLAEQALSALRRESADAAQASASRRLLTEVNIALSEPSLLRSTESHKLTLVGLWGGRKASTELSDLQPSMIAAAAAALRVDAASAPQDDANAVSTGQRAAIKQGPLDGDLDALTDSASELLEFRARETPAMTIEEGVASHSLLEARVLTSQGSDLACQLGWYELSAFGTAHGPGRDGKQRTSSFDYTGGQCEALRSRAAADWFGIGAMMRGLTRSIDTQGVDECFGGKFVGDVVLTPPAVATLLGWLHAQLSDVQLISGSSLYRDRVGTRIASSLLTLSSRFDAPGIAAMSSDAFATPPVQLLDAGQLLCLTPSLYGSRKTGLKHVPTAAGGWQLAAGTTPLSEMLGSVSRGALVGRLSMGNPAANGDFSGIIKNSFAMVGGEATTALAETMISANVARMLLDVKAVSSERIDTGAWCLPWLRVSGVHFS
jgi:PmbA protein